MRAVVIAVLFAAGGLLIASGAWTYHPGAGRVVAGAALVVWTLAVLAEVAE